MTTCIPQGTQMQVERSQRNTSECIILHYNHLALNQCFQMGRKNKNCWIAKDEMKRPPPEVIGASRIITKEPGHWKVESNCLNESVMRGHEQKLLKSHLWSYPSKG